MGAEPRVPQPEMFSPLRAGGMDDPAQAIRPVGPAMQPAASSVPARPLGTEGFVASLPSPAASDPLGGGKFALSGRIDAPAASLPIGWGAFPARPSFSPGLSPVFDAKPATLERLPERAGRATGPIIAPETAYVYTNGFIVDATDNPGGQTTLSTGDTLSVTGGNTVIGNQHAGSFTQNGGSFTTNGLDFYLGYSSGSAGTYFLGGIDSTLAVGMAYIGFGYNASAGAGGRGTFTQAAGNVTAAAVSLASLGGSTGTYNLDGGTLTTGSVRNAGFIGGASAFNFNGGTLRVGSNAATVAFFQNLARANVRDGGAIFDTNGFNVRVYQPLLHSNVPGDAVIDGGLTKVGAGTLQLGAVSTYTGPTTVRSGTLELFNATAGGVTAPLVVDATTGTAAISVGTSSRLSSGPAYVGRTGNGTFTLSDAAFSTNGNPLYLGFESGSNGTFNIYGGADTSPMSTGDIYVGVSGNGTFQQAAGSITVNGALYLGLNAGSRGSYSLEGGTLTTTRVISGGGTGNSFTFLGGTLRAAASSTSFFEGLTAIPIRGGAIDTNGFDVTVSQPFVDATSSVFFLFKRGAGTLTLTGVSTYTGIISVDAGVLSVPAGTLGTSLSTSRLIISSSAGSTAEILLSGTGALLAGGDVAVGGTGTSVFTHRGGSFTIGSTGALYVGSTSGSSTYNLSGTGQLSTRTAFIGEHGTGTFNQSGGNFSLNSATLILGRTSDGIGIYNLSDGALSAGSVSVGESGTGIFTQTGGSFTISGAGNFSRLYLGYSNGNGTFHLDGGTFTTNGVGGRSPGSTGTGIFNFNGGTLRAGASRADFFQDITTANVRGGGAVIDTNGFNVTVAQPLLHSSISGDNPTDGGLVKTGAGTLTLTGNSTYTGPTIVRAGTLAVNGALGGAGAVTVQGGATLTGSGRVAGPVTIQAGAVFAPGILALGPLSLGGDLTLESGASASFTLQSTTGTKALVSGAVRLGGNLVLALAAGYTPAVGETFYLIDGTGTGPLVGMFANAPEGMLVSNGGLYLVNYLAHDPSDGSNLLLNDLSVTYLGAVPEPGSWAAIVFGGSALLFLGVRRRGRAAGAPRGSGPA